MNVMIRFFNPNDTIGYTPDRPEEDLVVGPFPSDSIRMVYGTLYGTLMAGEPQDDDIAHFDTERGDWRPVGAMPRDGLWHDIQERLAGAGYSDWELLEARP